MTGSIIVAGDNGVVFVGEHAGWRAVDGLDSYAAIAIEVFQGRPTSPCEAARCTCCSLAAFSG